MALSAVQSGFSTVVSQVVPKAPWMRIALAVAGVVAVGYFAAKKVCAAWHGKVSGWGYSIQVYQVRTYLFGYTNHEIMRNLQKLAANSAPASAEEFSLQGAKYQAFSSSKLRSEVTKKPQGEAPELRFGDVMEKSRATIFINLTPSDGTRNQNLIGPMNASAKILSCPLWNNLSLDEQGPVTLKILDRANLVVQALQKNESVCIHYEKKADTTTDPTGEINIATFIAIIEFIRRRDQFKGASDVTLRLAMTAILEEIAKTARHRSPSRVYLDILLEPAFLRRLTA
jgi:hypothetical protein